MGAEYCVELAKDATETSTMNAFVAWGTLLASVAFATTGAALDDSPKGKGNDYTENRQVILLAGGGLLGAASAAFFSRSDAANNLGRAAHHGINLAQDEERYKACVAARGDWVGSRDQANGFGTKLASQSAAKKAKEAAATSAEEAAAAATSAEEVEPPP